MLACDICRKEIKRPTAWNKILIRTKIIKRDNKTYYIGEVIDICNDCHEKLEEALHKAEYDFYNESKVDI